MVVFRRETMIALRARRAAFRLVADLLRLELPVPPPTASPSPEASDEQLQRNRALYRKDWERDRHEEAIERRTVMRALRRVVFVILVVAIVSVSLVLLVHLSTRY